MSQMVDSPLKVTSCFHLVKASNAGEYTCNTFNAPTSSLNSSDSHTFTVVVQSELTFITNCVNLILQ